MYEIPLLIDSKQHFFISHMLRRLLKKKLSEKVRENYIAKIKDKLGKEANSYYVGLQTKPK